MKKLLTAKEQKEKFYSKRDGGGIQPKDLAKVIKAEMDTFKASIDLTKADDGELIFRRGHLVCDKKGQLGPTAHWIESTTNDEVVSVLLDLLVLIDLLYWVTFELTSSALRVHLNCTLFIILS